MRESTGRIRALATQSVSEDYEKNRAVLKELPLEGRLENITAQEVMNTLHQRKFSGYLYLTQKEKKKKIWYSNGDVFRVQSNVVSELFGQMLMARGWIEEEDLHQYLHLQAEFQKQNGPQRRLGDWVMQNHGCTAKELDAVASDQMIFSLLQAITWDAGEYRFEKMDFQKTASVKFKYSDLIQSLHGLLHVDSAPLGPLFKIVKPWNPVSTTMSIADTPIWAVFAGCRMSGLSGILSVRRQNKLYEVVIKFGIPLTYYEGTFGQPRQTVVVRQVSEEHERFFIQQIFRLFSFLSGSAYFRSLGETKRSSLDQENFLPPGTEGTRVTDPDPKGHRLSEGLPFIILKFHQLILKIKMIIFNVKNRLEYR